MKQASVFLSLALALQPLSALALQAPDTASRPGSEPAAALSSSELARGGGSGGRSGGGGGSRMGGGGRSGGGSRVGGSSRSGGSRGNNGFRNTSSSGMGRGQQRPSGGWSNSARQQDGRRSHSLDAQRGSSGNRDRSSAGRDRSNSGSRDRSSSGNRERSSSNRNQENRNSNRNQENRNNNNRNNNDRNNNNRRDNDRYKHDARRWDNDRWDRNYRHNHWNREVNINNVNLWGGGWARPGWGYARPWNVGWYGGWSSPPWGWWGVNAAAWGLSTLATAAIIDNAVDNAISSQRTYIVVPSSSYQLQYGTIQPINNSDVNIEFIVTDQGRSYQMTANCRDGELNGNAPNSGSEAQLLNAACQVAFGDAT